jgi:hypothetical protein
MKPDLFQLGYNIVHQFLRGDFIWQLPTLVSGLIAIIPATLSRRRWKQIAIYVIVFLTLTITLHMLADAPIHAFQKAWLEPMGPSLVLH